MADDKNKPTPEQIAELAAAVEETVNAEIQWTENLKSNECSSPTFHVKR